MRVAVLSVIAFGLIAAAPSRDQALKIMHDRHEGMETIGKSATRSQPRAGRKLAQPRQRPLVRRCRSTLCRARRRAGSPRAPAPSSARPAPSPKSGRTGPISPPSSIISRVRPKCSTRPPRAETWARSRRATPISAEPAKRATINIVRRCTTERARPHRAAAVGPSGPAGPLAPGRPDRVQLVVGPQSPHRLAHLVGLRDPDPASVPPDVGRGRKLDRALLELCPRTKDGARAICGALGAGSATRRWARSASLPCSPRWRSRSGSASSRRILTASTSARWPLWSARTLRTRRATFTNCGSMSCSASSSCTSRRSSSFACAAGT